MTQTEILEKRIATASRRYAAALEDAEKAIAKEKTKVIMASQNENVLYGVCSQSYFTELLKLNAELGALLALKDQIENQGQ